MLKDGEDFNCVKTQITNDEREKFRLNFSSASPKMRSLQKESLY